MTHVLGERDLASTLPLGAEDSFPEVFATSRMVALMEICSARLMKAVVPVGKLSVGVGIDITHLAATPAGETVRAVSTFLGMDGKLYRFKVEILDRGGVVGRGTHTRAVVDAARLVEGAQRRMAEAR
ncbi:MAG: thioesterase [Alphaproteobacteria bacterium]|nr:thioesterase [Alphaproteobacteria bacterium]